MRAQAPAIIAAAMRASIRFLLGALCALVAGHLVAAPISDPDPVNQGGPPSIDEPGGDSSPQTWSLHGQFTNVTQYHPAFRSPYRGLDSLDASNSGRETVDLTLYAGLRLWHGAAVYANPEVDQGFGLSTTVGLAGFSSGEAYKVGSSDPYYRMPRLFLRQVIGLGSEEVGVALGANQIAGAQPSDNVTLTVGKFSAVDVFDTNRYAHDPRADFMNWAMIASVAYDYAADAWGYSFGAAGEGNQSVLDPRGWRFAVATY